jgi:uncharacterized repeat protein (TIGR01451 family)
MTKFPNPHVASAGTNIAYTITLTNRGAAPARNIVVSDPLPAGLSFVSCSASFGGVCGGAGNNPTVSFPQLAGGASATVTIVAAADCAIADGTQIINTATVTTQSPERDVSNNSAQTLVIIRNLPPSIKSMGANPAVLWPANKKLVNVAVDYQVAASCGPVNCSLSVASNIPRDRDDDDDDHDCGCDEHHRHKDKHKHRKHRDRSCDHDHPKRDWLVIDANHVKLRANKGQHSKEHLYTITAACTNSLRASSTKTVVVRVPNKKPK